MRKLPSTIPVTIISGFLGAGKTTLLNRILNSELKLNAAVMVNDFGKINIDSELIVSAEQKTIKLSNGCLCCSVEEDLIAQLIGLSQLDEPPQHILIEASGVADPNRVIRSLNYPQLRSLFKVSSVISLVDIEQLESLDKDYYQLAQAQICAADIVIINKTDLSSREKIESFKQEWLFTNSCTLESQYAEIPLTLLFEQCFQTGSEPQKSKRNSDVPPDLPKFQQFFWQSSKPVDRKKIIHAIEQLGSSIYRAKGFVVFTESPNQMYVLQKVGSRVTLEPHPGETTNLDNRLVFIGQDKQRAFQQEINAWQLH